jgi:hypothetical protein
MKSITLFQTNPNSACQEIYRTPSDGKNVAFGKVS